MTDLATADLLAAGALDDAIAAAAARVKAQPKSAQNRMQLAELLVLTGDLTRAETHAKLAAQSAPADAVGIGLFRQYLRGLEARQRWWRDGAMPDFPGGPGIADQAALALNIALRDGDADAARQSLDELENARGQVPVTWNGTPADDLRNLDDRLPHAFEAVTSGGHYLWLDMARISDIACEPLKRPMDLACRAARVTLRDGSVADLRLCTIYPAPETDDQRLGRVTEFQEEAGGLFVAQGQLLFLLGNGDAALLEAEHITFPEVHD